MAINARLLVDITSRTITGGSADLVTNGMVLTTSDLIPADKPALEVTSATMASNFFGDDSLEARFALQYFIGLTNQQKAPESLVFGRLIAEPAQAWLRSATIDTDLVDLKKITDGAFSITVGGSTINVTELDLSSATSLSHVAQLVATKIGNTVTGEYNANLKAFIFKTVATGADASISFATAGDSGKDTATTLGLTLDAGAVRSSGADAMTPAKNLDAITAVTANWTQFTTLTEVTDETLAKAYSAWADVYDDAVYVFWSSDTKMANVLTQENTIAAKLYGNYNCTISVYTQSVETAATVLAYPATIKWDAVQGIKVLFGKAASGIPAIVTSEEEAQALTKIGVTYVGLFATRNAEFTFANNGALTSKMYGFYDVLIAQIWFKAKCQRACMDGFASVNRVPYNTQGFTMIRAWLADPIAAAKKVGVIDTGLSLSNAQKAQILQETRSDTVISDLENNGYWLMIESPESNVRAQRGSPTMNLLITYAGSVQKIELPITCVL